MNEVAQAVAYLFQSLLQKDQQIKAQGDIIAGLQAKVDSLSPKPATANETGTASN